MQEPISSSGVVTLKCLSIVDLLARPAICLKTLHSGPLGLVFASFEVYAQKGHNDRHSPCQSRFDAPQHYVAQPCFLA